MKSSLLSSPPSSVIQRIISPKKITIYFIRKCYYNFKSEYSLLYCFCVQDLGITLLSMSAMPENLYVPPDEGSKTRQQLYY